MKLELVKNYIFTHYKPTCLTCKFRGDVNVYFVPGVSPPKVEINGVLCKHPAQKNLKVTNDHKCEKFRAVNKILDRLFSMRKIL